MEISRLELSEDAALFITAVATREERHAVAHRLCGMVTGGSLRFEASGKPYVPGGPQVSISHSGALAACAVGPRPIGMDLERSRAVSPRLWTGPGRRAGTKKPIFSSGGLPGRPTASVWAGASPGLPCPAPHIVYRAPWNTRERPIIIVCAGDRRKNGSQTGHRLRSENVL